MALPNVGVLWNCSYSTEPHGWADRARSAARRQGLSHTCGKSEKRLLSVVSADQGVTLAPSPFPGFPVATFNILSFLHTLVTSGSQNGCSSLTKPLCKKELLLLAGSTQPKVIIEDHFPSSIIPTVNKMTNDLPPSHSSSGWGEAENEIIEYGDKWNGGKWSKERGIKERCYFELCGQEEPR